MRLRSQCHSVLTAGRTLTHQLIRRSGRQRTTRETALKTPHRSIGRFQTRFEFFRWRCKAVRTNGMRFAFGVSTRGLFCDLYDLILTDRADVRMWCECAVIRQIESNRALRAPRKSLFATLIHTETVVRPCLTSPQPPTMPLTPGSSIAEPDHIYTS